MLTGKLTETLDKVIQRHDELRDTLAAGAGLDGADYARMAKELSGLADVVAAVNNYRAHVTELEDLSSIIEDAESEGDVKQMAEEEACELSARLPGLERDIQILLLPKDEADEKNASWKCAPAPAATKRLCSPPICFACISVSPNAMAGRRS